MKKQCQDFMNTFKTNCHQNKMTLHDFLKLSVATVLLIMIGSIPLIALKVIQIIDAL